MAAVSTRRASLPSVPKATPVVRRNMFAYRRSWVAIVTGFFEPLFYLGAVGFGVGRFIGKVPFAGGEVPYAEFVAPGMLAASTLNGAIADGFFNPFFKLNWTKLYDGIISTPLDAGDIAMGEIVWAQIRGTIYSAGFLIVMWLLGLIHSYWALLALPAAMLSAAALAAGAMILTGATKQISSLEKVSTLVFFPLFLFSGTFFPVSLYPPFLQPLVEATPLYHAAALLRSLTTGRVVLGTLADVGYLLAMILVARAVAVRLLRRRLIH